MNHYTPWSSQDDTSLLQLRKQRKSHKAIARVLGRSPFAVGNRLQTRNRPRLRPDPLPLIISRITIRHCEVPDFYECGWRFVGFDDRQLCMFEWKSVRGVRWPKVGHIHGLEAGRSA